MSKLVAIGEFNTRLEAEITVNLLGSFDVESWISTDDLGGLGSARFPVYSIQAVTLCCIPVVTRRPGEQRKAFLN